MKFHRAEEGGGPDVAKDASERYMCPLTQKALNNVNPAAVLRPSGTVVSIKCVEKIIRKDMLDPFTGAHCADDAWIRLCSTRTLSECH